MPLCMSLLFVSSFWRIEIIWFGSIFMNSVLFRRVDLGNCDFKIVSMSSKVICLCLASSGESVESGSWIESDII